MSVRKLKHDWNTLEDYLSVHQQVWKKYDLWQATGKPFYSTIYYTDQYLELKTERFFLTTHKGTVVRIDIRKEVEIDDTRGKKKVARTFGYSYSCNLPSQSRSERGKVLLRYCSPHPPKEDEPVHHPYHHRHDGMGNVKIISDENDIPHVSEFLDEVLNSF